MDVKLFNTSCLLIKNQCYLIYEGNKGILIDPSWNYQLIDHFLMTQGITVSAILLTHAHLDHTDLAEAFATKYHIPVFMSAREIADARYGCANLRAIHSEASFSVDAFTISPIFTPGHTHGSTSYLIGGHLFSGDTIFIEGVGICTDPHQMFHSVQTLKRRLSPSTQVWPGHSFGQEPGKSMEYVLRNNVYFQFEKQEHFVNFRMRKNQPNPFNFF